MWVIGCVAAAVCVYLFLLCPRLPRRNIDALKGFDYAHRGLWNEEYPENSLPAFDRAARRGFGMELDVHLTADEKLCVVHDGHLLRMCGVDAHVSACTLAQLQSMRLKGTEYTIPTFSQVLDTVDGRVPLIVELKTGANNALLCRKTLDMLRAYGGAYCVESFDPRIVRWFRQNAPDVIRGQLAYCPKKPTLTQYLAGTLMSNALGRPDFVAWGSESQQTLGMALMEKLFHPWLVAWTIRSEEALCALKAKGRLVIFEGFWNKNDRNDK